VIKLTLSKEAFSQIYFLPMQQAILLEQLARVEQLATASKLNRLLAHPLKYAHAILHRKLIYTNNKKSKEVTASTFFGKEMSLLLPASTDIYLTGGKSHNSEIRLAKFLINNLATGDIFLDVGAHYGYFTLLAATLVSNSGQVVAFEASKNTFAILTKNTQQTENISVINKAVSDEAGSITFYEFPNLYSEYNSIDIKQFKNTDWFSKESPVKNTVATIPLAIFLEEQQLLPTIIKIDVEGAEFKVISGLQKYLVAQAPLIAMEYVSSERKNEAHQKAAALLTEFEYESYTIDKAGALVLCVDIDTHLAQQQVESDNIVFKKKYL